MGVLRQFPYSNFHEMNMDEIIKIIKDMLEEWANYHAEWDSWMDQMNDDWSNYQDVMNEAWENMQSFINNYFDNLDLQEEVNNKIVHMIQTGEFGLLVNEYIPPAVNAWLNLHITEPEGVVIDTSLTVEGACADAKATGDAIAQEQRNLNAQLGEPITVNPFNFENGNYWGVSAYPTYSSVIATGSDANSIRTINPVYIPEDYYLNTGNKLNIRLISAVNGTFSQIGDYETDGTVMQIPFSGYYHMSLRLVHQNETVTDIAEVLSNMTISDPNGNSIKLNELYNYSEELELKGFYLTKYSPFQIGGLTDGQITSITTRIVSTNICEADVDLVIHITNGFRIGIHEYDDSDVFIKDSGWLSNTIYRIVKGTKFRAVIAPIAENEYTIYNGTDAIPDMVSKVQCNIGIDDLAFMLENSGGVYEYETSMAYKINTRKQMYNVGNIAFSAYEPYSPSTIPQDIACYDEVLFVAHNKTNEECITLQDIETGEFISTVSNTAIGHGNALSFSNMFYDANDRFPILFISTESNNIVNAFRITTSNLTLIKSYAFSDVGYYANHCIDPLNNILYMIGYAVDSYNDPTNNYCIISAFDLNNEIDNGDNTYSAQLLFRRNIPFILTHQGNTFFNNHIFVLSSDYDQHNTKIYIIDLKGNIVNIMEEFPSPIPDRECEGIAFYEDDHEYKMMMLDGNAALYTINFRN